MRGYKGSTIYKNRLCELRPEHVVRACNRNKARS